MARINLNAFLNHREEMRQKAKREAEQRQPSAEEVAQLAAAMQQCTQETRFTPGSTSLSS